MRPPGRRSGAATRLVFRNESSSSTDRPGKAFSAFAGSSTSSVPRRSCRRATRSPALQSSERRRSPCCRARAVSRAGWAVTGTLGVASSGKAPTSETGATDARETREPIYILEPGGSLHLDVALPDDPALACSAQIEGRDGELLFEQPLDGAPIVVDGLPIGSAVVRFVAETGRHRGLALAAREVAIAASSPVRLTLDLRPLWRPDDFGWIHVAVHLESESDTGALELSVEALEAPDARRRTVAVASLRPAPERGRVWGTGPRAVGRHRIAAAPGSAEIEVNVERGAIAYAALEVPALPRLRLWPTDAATRAPVRPDLVAWRLVGASDWQLARPTDSEGGFVFPVARGSVEIAVRADGFGTTTFPCTVQHAWQEQIVSLEAVVTREILVRLTSGGHPVPAPPSTWSSIVATNALGDSVVAEVRPIWPEALASTAFDSDRALVVVRGAGACQLTLGHVPGFAPPAPTSIPAGTERRTVDYELTFAGAR